MEPWLWAIMGLALISPPSAYAATPIEAFLSEQQQLVKEFSSAVETRISRVATAPANFSCNCVYHECGGTFEAGGVCEPFGSPEHSRHCPTKKPGCISRRVHYSRPFIRTPRGVSVKSPNVDDEVFADICMLEGLEGEGVYKAATKSNGTGLSGWAYIGTQNGAMVSWPGNIRPGFGDSIDKLCEPYDPRLRPWYVPAMSAHKSIVMLIDSAVVAEADTAINRILSTLSPWDNAAIVPLDMQNIERLPEDVPDIRLHSVTDEGKVAVKENLKGQKFALDSSFSATFRKFKSTAQDSKDQMIIFISGSSSKSEEQEIKLLETVSQLRSDFEQDLLISILTFTISSPPFRNSRLARQLACENYGLWTSLTDFDNPNLDNYFSLIRLAAEHAKETPNVVYFSPAYEDEGGLGSVITISRAVYREYDCQETPGPKRELMGCVGIDTRMKRIDKEKLADNYARSLDGANAKSISIRNVKNLSCQLQILREKTGSECPGRLETGIGTHVTHEGKVFAINLKDRKNFNDALGTCLEHDGTLASLSPGVWTLISSIAPTEGAWIGLNETENGRWSWIDSSDYVRSDTVWAGDEDRGKCGLLDNRGAKNNIRKADCSMIRPFICQFDTPATDATSNLTNTPGDCTSKNMCKPGEKINITKLNLAASNKSLVCNWSGSGSDAAVCCNEEDADRICGYEGSKDPLETARLPLAASGMFIAFIAVLVAAYIVLKKYIAPPPPPPSDLGREMREGCVLGRGACGEVRKGTHEGRPVALKIFFSNHVHEADRELEIFKRLPVHRNIIRCWGEKDQEIDGSRILILDLMDMNLDSYWKIKRRQPVTYKSMVRIFLEIGKGLQHLHENKVIHRDVKPQNILVKNSETSVSIKLCDFGHSKEYVSGPASLSCPRGTRGYMSPEMVTCTLVPGGAVAGTPTDIFSFGVVMCESFLGMKAFYPDWVNQNIPPQLKNLICDCLRVRDSERPYAWQVCTRLEDFLRSEWSSSHVIFDVKSESQIGS